DLPHRRHDHEDGPGSMSSRTQSQRDASSPSYWTLRRIGAAVAIRRGELELDQDELAARLGVPTATVAAIEQGRYDPRLALDTAPGTFDHPGAGPSGTQLNIERGRGR